MVFVLSCTKLVEVPSWIFTPENHIVGVSRVTFKFFFFPNLIFSKTLLSHIFKTKKGIWIYFKLKEPLFILYPKATSTVTQNQSKLFFLISMYFFLHLCWGISSHVCLQGLWRQYQIAIMTITKQIFWMILVFCVCCCTVTDAPRLFVFSIFPIYC